MVTGVDVLVAATGRVNQDMLDLYFSTYSGDVSV